MTDASIALQDLPDRNIALLRVTGALPLEMRREFIEACESLVDSDRGKLVIDLTGALSISSMFLGTIADFSQRAAACGKHLAVLAGGRLARLFNQTSLQEIVDVVVVDHAL